uniref:Putative secreted protein n=1 Tax=Anopheles darlingi TaxID=43151 RepID=A0A2M4DJL2_ANODA
MFFFTIFYWLSRSRKIWCEVTSKPTNHSLYFTRSPERAYGFRPMLAPRHNSSTILHHFPSNIHRLIAFLDTRHVCVHHPSDRRLSTSVRKVCAPRFEPDRMVGISRSSSTHMNLNTDRRWQC